MAFAEPAGVWCNLPPSAASLLRRAPPRVATPTRGSPVALETTQAIRLARTLRELRESAWPDVELTQAQLAKALSADSRVASATLSSWESLTNPKTPTASRLTGSARFFATRRSVEGKEPRLLTVKELDADELERFRELEAELLGLLRADTELLRGTFAFDEGPVTIICPEVPEAE